MQLSPLLAELAQYPFAQLDDWRADARDRGIDVIDFGVGDPREATPAFIREALVAGVAEVSSYPRAVGLPEFREAVSVWIARRFGVETDPSVEIVPTLGSKEAIFSFAQIALGGRRVVAMPSPGYPVYERGALFAGGEVASVPLREETGWLPDLDAFDRWDEIAVFWTCYPNNPTGATAPLSFYEELAGRAREHGFLLCSDEAYSELWFGEAAPASALQVEDRSQRRRLQHALEALLDDRLPLRLRLRSTPVGNALRAFRPTLGTAPQEFVQRAGIDALSDERHVEAVRDVYRRKRETLLPVLRRKGLRLAGGDATFFLWVAVDGSSEDFARRLLEHGVLVAPGAFFGPDGEGYVRMALVPSQSDCERAARILENVL